MSRPVHFISTAVRRRSPRWFEFSPDRKGAAAVEFAVTLPLCVLLVFGAIDIGRALVVQHKLVEAARAGCRLYAIKNELTEEDAQAAVDQVMDDANLEGYKTEFDPNSQEAIKQLSPVSVSVSIPFNDVAWMSSWFLPDRTLTGTCVMPGDTGERRDDSDEDSADGADGDDSGGWDGGGSSGDGWGGGGWGGGGWGGSGGWGGHH